jgi:hypothetical protein
MSNSNRESHASRGRVLMAISLVISLALTAVLVYPYSGNQRTQIAQIGKSIAHLGLSQVFGGNWSDPDSNP